MIITPITFSPDGKFVLSASVDSTVELWDICTGTCIRTLAGIHGKIHSLSFSPNGKYALSVCVDSTLQLWNLNCVHCKQNFNVYPNVVFSSDGSQFLVENDKGENMEMVDTSGFGQHIFIGYNQFIRTMAVSHNGRYFISSTGDSTIMLKVIGL